MRNIFVCITLALVVIPSLSHADPPGPGPLGEVTVVDFPEHRMASELWGTWYPHSEPGFESWVIERIEFRVADEASERMVAALTQLLGEMVPGPRYDMFARAVQMVWTTGEVEVMRADGVAEVVPFALVTALGGPLLLVLDSDGEDIDLETNFITMGVDPTGDNDILFLGGDHADEPYMFMRRTPATP